MLRLPGAWVCCGNDRNYNGQGEQLCALASGAAGRINLPSRKRLANGIKSLVGARRNW